MLVVGGGFFQALRQLENSPAPEVADLAIRDTGALVRTAQATDIYAVTVAPTRAQA